MSEKKVVVLEDRCPQDHQCPSVKICPVGALTQDGFNAPVVNYTFCLNCKQCVDFCPMEALQMQ